MFHVSNPFCSVDYSGFEFPVSTVISLGCSLHVFFQVPEVVRTEYQLIDLSDDGFVSISPCDHRNIVVNCVGFLYFGEAFQC